jgi:hypothetical protein
MNKTAETFSKCASELTWRGVLGFLAVPRQCTAGHAVKKIQGYPVLMAPVREFGGTGTVRFFRIFDKSRRGEQMDGA